MAKKLYTYCMSKPYAWAKGTAQDIRVTVKKVALEFALCNNADIAEVMEAVNTVSDMIGGRYTC